MTTREASLVPVASLDCSEASEDFHWKKEVGKKQDEVALPLTSSFPDSASCFSLPARVVRRLLRGHGLGLGLPAAVLFAPLPWQPQGSDGEWHSVTRERTVCSPRRLRCSLPMSHCNLLCVLGFRDQGLKI